ncbi:MAG: hypothetical protein H0X25_00990 [Acidobacteriales bacterium]|nr:hypothetical protein [Terriglobales bacterium]
MGRFAILDSRKRALIALVHTLLFLTIAALQMALSQARPWSFHHGKLRAALVLPAIYLIVTAVLVFLLRLACCVVERLYFSLCAASALLGLFRMMVGDPVLHANVLRVLLLTGAAITGAFILRSHSGAGDYPACTGDAKQ